jgi:hypothetical protein
MFYGTATTLSGTEKRPVTVSLSRFALPLCCSGDSPDADAKTAPSDGSVPSGSTTCQGRRAAMASGTMAAHACVVRHDSLFWPVSGASVWSSKLHASFRNRPADGDYGHPDPQGSRFFGRHLRETGLEARFGNRFAAFTITSGAHNSPYMVHSRRRRRTPARPGTAAEPRIARRNRSRLGRGTSKFDLH